MLALSLVCGDLLFVSIATFRFSDNGDHPHPLDLLQSTLTGTPVTAAPPGTATGCPVAVPLRRPPAAAPPASLLTAIGGILPAALAPLGLPKVISSDGSTPAGPRCGRATPADASSGHQRRLSSPERCLTARKPAVTPLSLLGRSRMCCR